MSRWLCIPGPVRLLDIFSDEPGEFWPFAKTGTALCAAIVQARELDILDAIDLRTKLRQPEGTWVEIVEAEYSVLEAEAKRPKGILTPGAQLSLGEHFRAILSAPAKKPAVLSESVNGALPVTPS